MGNASARILVVDDQPNIVDMLVTVLTFHGFAVDSATTVAQAEQLAESERPDLVVLDVMLPDGDGFDLCRRLRQRGHRFGIVFLTARDARRDLVSGLTLGGDDYLTKPFAVEELLARVRAVLRRVGSGPAGRDGPAGPGDPAGTAGRAGSMLRYADLELDEDTLLVQRAGTPVQLSPTEFKLLRYLMLNSGRVLSRSQILEAVWRYDFGGESNVVDTYIGYLRRKLDPLGEPLIVTHRGFGYALRTAVQG
ncbi:winged helix family two component transcriptional regulator [Micromonospora sp. Llam0]|uniref:response regulator transcription factor n=1 Tax=Micromonospora sp. Llam0 TaxID=2485143 RepID=UPI000F49B26D|nr:response regulator transcription factor [Micromonospora sp. Llam0]ROO53000.1 winged helix family two component transcriptional regulator [Micromonospora sp. Llam0]